MGWGFESPWAYQRRTPGHCNVPVATGLLNIWCCLRNRVDFSLLCVAPNLCPCVRLPTAALRAFGCAPLHTQDISNCLPTFLRPPACTDAQSRGSNTEKRWTLIGCVHVPSHRATARKNGSSTHRFKAASHKNMTKCSPVTKVNANPQENAADYGGAAVLAGPAPP